MHIGGSEIKCYVTNIINLMEGRGFICSEFVKWSAIHDNFECYAIHAIQK